MTTCSMPEYSPSVFFSNEDSVDVVVGSLVAGNGAAGSDIGEEVECAAQGEIEGDVAFANGSSKRAFKGDVVPLYRLNRLVGDDSATVLEAGSYIDRLPLDGHSCGRVDVFDCL